MSHIHEIGDDKEGKNIFKDFIKIQCLVENCQNAKTNLVSVPVLIKINSKDEKRIIGFICQQHIKQQNLSNNKYENISIIQAEVQKLLKPAPVGEHQILFHNAAMKLDSKSCCFRENKKYQNLDTLMHSFSILSNDDNVTKKYIQRIMTQKYFQLFEVQKKIKEELKKEAYQLNPLYVISLIENKNQIVRVLAKIEYMSIIKTTEMLQVMRISQIQSKIQI